MKKTRGTDPTALVLWIDDSTTPLICKILMRSFFYSRLWIIFMISLNGWSILYFPIKCLVWKLALKGAQESGKFFWLYAYVTHSHNVERISQSQAYCSGILRKKNFMLYKVKHVVCWKVRIRNIEMKIEALNAATAAFVLAHFLPVWHILAFCNTQASTCTHGDTHAFINNNVSIVL